jgi:PAP2 superfamily
MALINRAFRAEPAPVDAAPQSTPKPVHERLHLRLVHELAIHDWIVISYLTVLTLAVSMSEDSPVRTRCLGHVAMMLAFAVVVLTFVRGGLVKDNFVAPLAYRFAVYGTVQISYFELRELLPLVNPSALDAQLSFIDEHVLHFEPSLFMDRLVTPTTTEWFAFFYFGYFALLASHVLPMVFVSRRSALVAPFALGMIFVYAMAHTLYMVVPGYGPVRYLAERYQHDLPSGVWLNAVLNAVQSGGAQKDIFPSLHTAGPVFISLFSFHHRDKLPFKYTWPFVSFFSANIVIATMFLRWHYLIDVIAGLTLSVGGFYLATWVSRREVQYREQNGYQPVWPPISLAFGRAGQPRREGA